MTKLKKFLLKHKVFILILVMGVFFRSYKAQEYFLYSHDQDLLGWVIRDILSGHFRLIGQETSTKGVYIGGLFYYSLIPFYLAFGMNPIGGLLWSILVGAVTICSIYFVIGKVFNKNISLLASFVYSFSFLIVFTDREVVPTTLMMLWSVWFLYSIYQIMEKSVLRGLIIGGILFGLVWHINLSLLILSPVFLIAVFFSRKKVTFKSILISAFVFAVTVSPFLIFEIRHDFLQINSIVNSLSSDSGYIEGTAKGIGKWDRTMQLVYKNTTNVFFGPLLGEFKNITFFVLLGGLFYGVNKKIISKKWFILYLSWIILFISFFSINSINLSEYYLNGMNIVWITIFAIIVSLLFVKNKKLGILILGLFAIVNMYKFFTAPLNKSGFLERSELVRIIKEDAQKHGYPCISISYIVTPGNDFGYRYLFWLNKLHVNQPKSQSPVYTIVFPHSLVDRIDKSVGALGLIWPDYEKYEQKNIEESCKGENSNETDPMFGYTE